MLPFSKRPPPPEEYFLRSGDFEAVNGQARQVQAPRSHGYPNEPIPSAPRAPIFARQAAQTPYGSSQGRSYGHAPQQPGHYADLSAPPPPHSLAPVAMGSERSHTGSVVSTGAQLAQTVLIREKPSLKWGVMIALGGALLGGVLGLGMDAKRQQARAAAASEARDAAPASAARITAPTPAALDGINAAPAIPPGPTLASDGLPAPTPAAPAALAAPTPAAPAGVRAPAVLPPSTPITVPPVRHAVTPRATPVKHQSFVAARVAAPKQPPPEKAEAPAKAEAPTKGDAAAKGDKAPPSDARKVLEAAIKDTTNTL